MSTLSQFFGGNAIGSLTGGSPGKFRVFMSSGSQVIPSNVTHIAYAVMGGGGSSGTYGTPPGYPTYKTGAGGGFSFQSNDVSIGSPITMTVTVGAAGSPPGSGGTSSISAPPATPTITATGGGQYTTVGTGSGGLINTSGGQGAQTPGPVAACGGAGGLYGPGGGGSTGSVAGGGGFGSGGGGGGNGGRGGGGGDNGDTSSGGNGLVGRGAYLPAGSAEPGYIIQYNERGNFSLAKTFFAACGGGAFSSPSSGGAPAGSGGGGSGAYSAGFGGGAGANSITSFGGGGISTPGTGVGLAAIEWWED